MADQEIVELESPKEKLSWNAEQTRFLIARRLEIEDKFNSGKPKAYHWGKITDAIHDAFKEPPFQPTVGQVQKKWDNEVANYRKEKRGKSKSGSSPPKYKFFNDFERVYHGRKDLNLENTYRTQGPPMEAVIPATLKRKELPLDEDDSDDDGNNGTDRNNGTHNGTSSAEKQRKRRTRDTRTIMLKKLDEMEEKSAEGRKTIVKMVEDMTKGQEQQNNISLEMLKMSQEFLQVVKGWSTQ